MLKSILGSSPIPGSTCQEGSAPTESGSSDLGRSLERTTGFEPAALADREGREAACALAKDDPGTRIRAWADSLPSVARHRRAAALATAIVVDTMSNSTWLGLRASQGETRWHAAWVLPFTVVAEICGSVEDGGLGSAPDPFRVERVDETDLPVDVVRKAEQGPRPIREDPPQDRLLGPGEEVRDAVSLVLDP